MKKYAIFGGSFDPPHLCHEKIAALCVERLELERLFVVPTFLSPFKSSFSAPPEIRYEWLKKIFFKYDKVEVTDIEIKKQRSVYTAETADELSKLLGKRSCDTIYLIIGSDNLGEFEKWHKYDELIQIVEPIVVARDRIISEKYKTVFLDCDFSSTAFRDKLDASMLPIEIREDAMRFYGKEKDGIVSKM